MARGLSHGAGEAGDSAGPPDWVGGEGGGEAPVGEAEHAAASKQCCSLGKLCSKHPLMAGTSVFYNFVILYFVKPFHWISILHFKKEYKWFVKTTFDPNHPSPLQYIAALFNSAGCKSNKAGRGVVCAS